MARGLQIITPSSSDPEPAQADDDLILVQPIQSAHHNNNYTTNDHLSNIANSVGAVSTSSSNTASIYDSVLSTICVRPPVPSIEVTRQAGEALFMDFCQSHIAFEPEDEILPGALPEDVAPSVTRLIK